MLSIFSCEGQIDSLRFLCLSSQYQTCLLFLVRRVCEFLFSFLWKFIFTSRNSDCKFWAKYDVMEIWIFLFRNAVRCVLFGYSFLSRFVFLMRDFLLINIRILVFFLILKHINTVLGSDWKCHFYYYSSIVCEWKYINVNPTEHDTRI